ncbi:MAG TPA: HEAT repeat domain-containing protein [Bacillota bacterium]|nr:HEAT repeat domain-containing protein [Bacillota bacterium]
MSNMSALLFFSIALLLLLTLILLTYVLVLRWQTEYRNAVISSKTVEWNNIVSTWLETGKAEAIQAQYAPQFLEFLAERCDFEVGASSIDLGNLLEHLGLDKIIRQNLKKRNIYDKAWAIHLAGLFNLTGFKNEIIPYVDHGHDLVSFVACQSLAKLLKPTDEFFFQLLFRLIGRHSLWTTEKLAEIIIQMGSPAGKKLLDFLSFSEVKGKLLLFIIDLLGEMKLTEAGPELHRRLRAQLAGDSNNETMVRLIRNLGLLGYAPAITDITGLLHHDAWFIRSQVSRTLGDLKTENMLAPLSEAMSDSNWWVRHNAGNALSNFGPAGIRRLQEIAGSEGDRFAREMASLILEKRGV